MFIINIFNNCFFPHLCRPSHLSLEVSSMTDEERDQIDTDAETYMRTCSVAIQTLKNEGTVHVNYSGAPVAQRAAKWSPILI